MGKIEFISGVILFIFGLTVFVWSMNYPFGSINAPGPGFVPRVMSLILAAVSLQIIASSREKSPSKEAIFPSRGAFRRVITAAFAFSAYRVLFPIFGFVPTNFVFFLFITRSVTDHSWKVIFLFSILATAAAYILFEVWLGIQMPSSFFSKVIGH